MNQFERDIGGRPAILEYLDGEYRVVSPGSHVLCAVTGTKIPLEALRYWSVDLQEAYAGPGAALKRLQEKGADAAMSDLRRREFVLAGMALAAVPVVARGQALATGPVGVPGDAVQGALVIGEVGSGAEVSVDGKPVRVQSGRFCFGFGRDAAKPAEVRVRFEGGREVTRMVSPQKRNFVIQRIDGLPEQYVSPPPEVLDRIKRDAYAVGEVRARDTDEMWFADKFIWPTDGPISSIYGSQRILNGEPREPHYGVDIAAPEGAPIRAPVGGIVTLAHELYLSGNTMVIDHGHGVSTSYLHMSRIDVKVGDRLDQGDQIGLVGKTGRVTGPHLCWRLNWFQTRLDVALLSPPRKGDRA